jgi:cytochrome bd ubiquinol oxidase subunit I
MLILFAILYTVLGVTFVFVLRKMFKRNPVEREMRKRGITNYEV